MAETTFLHRGIPNLGQSFGNYVFCRILAEGGMGIVLEAEQVAIGRKVALKIVSPKYAARNGYSPQLIDTFMHEARVLGAIDHPNVVTLYDAGLVGQCPFMAIRLVSGGDLGTRVLNHGPLTDLQALRVMAQCASGLFAVHHAGYINRDIKPANILLETDDTPRLTDFGLAVGRGQPVSNSVIAGTPSYLAPEQINCGTIDERTDIYALGATMFYAVTGKPPFQGATPQETIKLVRDAIRQPTTRVARPHLKPQLGAIIRRAMALNPDKRYATAQQIVHDCDLVLNGEEPEHAGPSKRKHKGFFSSIVNR